MAAIEKGIPAKEIGILVLVLAATALIVIAGVSGKKVWFIDGPRSAVITLGVIGMAFCTFSVGKFITGAPAHPLAILGYLIGAAALLTFLGQLFRWKLPLVADPQTALYVLAACVLAKTVIARLYNFIR